MKVIEFNFLRYYIGKDYLNSEKDVIDISGYGIVEDGSEQIEFKFTQSFQDGEGYAGFKIPDYIPVNELYGRVEEFLNSIEVDSFLHRWAVHQGLEPFVAGDKVMACCDMYFGFQASDDDVIKENDVYEIDEVVDEDSLFFTTIPNHYGSFPAENFILA